MKNVASIILNPNVYRNAASNNILRTVDLNNTPWNSGNMERSFRYCQSLEAISNINNNVTNMQYSFEVCSNLSSIDRLPSSALNLDGTFEACSNMVDMPIIPNSVVDMSWTFADCYKMNSFTSIPDSVTRMSETFRNCSNLEEPMKISNSVTGMYGTFKDCINLKNAPNLANCTNLTAMTQTFDNCQSLLTAPTIPNSVIGMYATFFNCFSLSETPNIPQNVNNIEQCFQDCHSLVNCPDLSNCNKTSLMQTFSDCYSMTTITNIPTNVVNMYGTFYNCQLITNAPEIPELVKDMTQTFYGCTSLFGNVNIHSKIIQDANYCFSQTSLNKNVFIPFYYKEPIDYTQKYAWKDSSDVVYYTKNDVYNITNGTSEWYSFDIFDSSGSYICSGHYAPWEIYDYSLDNGTGITYDSANNVIIHKNAGDSTFTYDAFINAGYGTDENNRVNGVVLKDIDYEVNLADWEYTKDRYNNVVLTKYIGSNSVINVPHLI